MSDTSGEPWLVAVAALVVSWSALVGCAGFSARPPVIRSGCYPGAEPLTCNVVHLEVTADGPVRVTTNGRTVESFASTTFSIQNVAMATHEIAGTMWARHVTISLRSAASTVGGSVQRGTMSVIAGPSGVAGPCSVSYAIPKDVAVPQTFRAQYAVTTGTDPC